MMRLLLLGALVAVFARARSQLRVTPFGVSPASCVVALESGALVEELAAGSLLGPSGHVRVRHAWGAEEVLLPCTEEPRVVAPRRLRMPPTAAPPYWRGWPQHTWLGAGWASFTSPPLPADEIIWSINATWEVPPAPRNTRANGSDPWAQAPPTLSWWVGLQGPTVLQPVLEWNGLTERAYDAVSWNCCPGGMVFHSPPVAALPGDEIIGEIVRVSGAEVNASSSLYTYATRTAVRGGAETLLYSAMSEGEAGWAPDWAEVVQESYFVTSCDRLPCSGGEFAHVRVSTSQTGARFNASAPSLVPAVPWSLTYAVAGAATPQGAPVCAADVALGGRDASVNVTYDCSAAH